MIPLIDLTIDVKTKKTIKREIIKVVESKSYILGKRVEIFEKKFAKFIGTKYAIGVGSGTDALRLCLRALEIGNGDKVLTVALTSPFTAIAIVEEGATPVFCDVDEKTWTIDIAEIENKIDKKTKAIIPVHLFGNPCNIEVIIKLAKEHKLFVIEDACQAHGARYKNKMIGSFGDCAAFSFYPTKNLGAMGDGGILVTSNKKIAEMAKILRHGGQTKRFWHKYRGINSRLDEIQAAILHVKLNHIASENQKRQKLAKRYKRAFKNLPILFQETITSSTSANHLFTIRIKERELLQKYLMAKNIASDIYYPYPVHLQKAFRKYYTGKLPITEKIVDELLAIPISPNLSFKKQDLITNSIINFYKNK